MKYISDFQFSPKRINADKQNNKYKVTKAEQFGIYGCANYINRLIVDQVRAVGGMEQQHHSITLQHKQVAYNAELITQNDISK